MRFLKPQDYQPEARAIYARLAKKIEDLLPNAHVEHIGSSAVDGMISKGDLDIYVEASKKFLDEYERLLLNQGFERKTDTFQSQELRMLVSNEFDIDVAIQLVDKDSKYTFFKTFRDVLKSSKKERDNYNSLKMSCIPLTQEEYREKKSKFINRILQGG
ncbi:hypothetical protein AS19_27810 [Alcanivorax sp. NBRC 101098]|uniref:GrpB family protein n=1 Tax=Alcanivorax sp. NBRC 101098 TaxID=1113728 RepID=UPI0004ABD88D|nr:GrpB family protein [Alcanivorax sp. NBRC 101098]BAP15632.1 hypothetical protein AS19_27810 [Alcanivorax sp. NBRC 101098]